MEAPRDPMFGTNQYIPTRLSNGGRRQPWKAFCDPESPKFADAVASAPKQKPLGVGKDAVSQYNAENGG
jgi:hypothetical protein